MAADPAALDDTARDGGPDETARDGGPDETARLAALARYDVLDTAEPPELQAIARLAARVAGVPNATVNLIDRTRQWQAATEGFERGEVARGQSMCVKVLHEHRPVVVPDASVDARWSDNPWVTGELARIRFYAAAPLVTPDDHVLGTLCVYDDVVRRLEPEQVHALGELARQVVQWLELRRRTRELQDAIGELERSNAELSSFAARVAHDLRNPLAAVLGFLQLLQRHFATELSDAGQEVVTAALKAADGMRSLVDDLLSYAAAGVTPELVDVDLDEVVAAVQLALAPALGRSGGRIVTDAPLGTVRGDRTLLRQLVQNLVANSLKFGREGVPPLVWISRGDAESGWSLIVADNGRGVPAEDRAHVFDLFARARNVAGAPGTGIGLATCARIAEVLGGVLEVADTPGGGATFTLLVR